MLRPVLRIHNDRLIISTPIGFRIVFAAIALVLMIGVLWFSNGRPFVGARALTFIMFGVCFSAALFLERWIFDRSHNRFERNFGLVFFYVRRTVSLDSIEAVDLRHLHTSVPFGRLSPTESMRQTAVLSVVENQGRRYVLDVARGYSIAKTIDVAQRLSAFCGIPLQSSGTTFIE